MGKLSSFERVVGRASEADKEEVLQEAKARFNNQEFRDLQGKERPKTPEDLQIIDLANQVTNGLRREYGLGNFDIPSQNIHIINKEDWPNDKEGAFFTPMLQTIGAVEQPSRLVLMKNIIHEMLHFKSYGALQFVHGDEARVDQYRGGLTVHTRDGENVYFTDLDEAVTEELTRQLLKQVAGDSLLVQEIKETQRVMRENPDAITGTGELLFGEETYYAEIDNQSEVITTESFTRTKERAILNTLMNKILEFNGQEFKDREAVFAVFVKAMLTGNILPLGRLIDMTFGGGTFKQIGELDKNIEKQRQYVESL
ncbi:hypothetical protein EPO05_03615 [Patescibacteria group bacterium]|nr:MAG: hypothetical protein EPO05_03615 [Patescibacteria group bacterium]